MQIEKGVVSNGKVEKRAQELIIESAKEIMVLQDRIQDIKDEIKEIKTDAKGEGLKISALNGAIRRITAIQNGKSKEDDLSEEDMYLEVLLKDLEQA